MRHDVRFLLNGAPVCIENPDPTLTLLDYLRDVRRLTGTKEGCREGDCGACTVTLARRDGKDLKIGAVNACILFLPSLDGSAIMTVEGVGGPNGTLHPVQQAMVDLHGSQCGFCTPGFVMSMHAASFAGKRPTRERINEMLAGNLCRCTGYGPIVAAAGRSLVEDAGRASQMADIERAIGALDDSAMLAIDYVCPRRRARLRYFAPRSLDQLLLVISQNPGATLLAGGTDVGLWVTKQQRVLRCLVDLSRVSELREIIEDGDGISVGAGVTLSDARAPLAARFPALDRLLSRFASEQIRNRGTVGGNIANGSPIGDMPPALIALGASVGLSGPSGARTLPLDAFFIAYGQQDRAREEVVSHIRVPDLAPDAHFDIFKITKRFDQDISAVCGAFHLRLDDGVMRDVRICFGGMAGIPKRASNTERLLEGRRFEGAVPAAALEALAADYAPMSDHRASAEYRSLVAGNLLRKFFAGLNGEAVARLERETAL